MNDPATEPTTPPPCDAISSRSKFPAITVVSSMFSAKVTVTLVLIGINCAASDGLVAAIDAFGSMVKVNT